MRTIGVMNQKGGCGKTTTAVNLAGALHARGRRVLVVDLDPQAHATLGLNGRALAPIARTVHDALMRRVGLDPVLVPVAEGFDLAPSGDDMLFAERDLGAGAAAEERLLDALRMTQRSYDVALLDCPPSLGPLTLNALKAAGEILVPVETSFFALNGVSQFLRALHRYRRSWLAEKPVRALATLFDRRTAFAREVIEEMRRFFGPALCSTVIHNNVKLREAASFGLPITQYDRRSRGCLDHLALADELLGEAAGQRHPPRDPAPAAAWRGAHGDRPGPAAEPASR
ncbi:MAG TPA: ParA family protein [Candidatus Polarisedimenticolia bacterium]|nr:ParA family protein [Candidatus Polarisedimenticolia bacterium]